MLDFLGSMIGMNSHGHLSNAGGNHSIKLKSLTNKFTLYQWEEEKNKRGKNTEDIF